MICKKHKEPFQTLILAITGFIFLVIITLNDKCITSKNQMFCTILGISPLAIIALIITFCLIYDKITQQNETVELKVELDTNIKEIEFKIISSQKLS